jgi:hypothetical protein
MLLGTMTFSVVLLGIMTQHNDTKHNETQHNETQHNETQHIDTQRYDTKHIGFNSNSQQNII